MGMEKMPIAGSAYDYPHHYWKKLSEEEYIRTE